MKKTHTAIIGGGAAGLFLASALPEHTDTLLLERGERVGRKLSATGNGQGNVTNLEVSADKYFSFSAPKGRIEAILSRHGEEDMLDFLSGLGGLFLPDRRNRVYPAGRQASAITDLLRFSVAAKGVKTETGAFVRDVEKNRDGFLLAVRTADGEEKIQAEKVVLCAGGKAAKNFGTDGNAYALAGKFGHTVTPLYPSLVQLKTAVTDIKSLRGIRTDALVSAYSDGEEIAKERGDVIFTDYGVSGDAIFRLSAFLADRAEKCTLSLEFLPDVDEETLHRLLERRIGSSFPENEILCGILNNQLGRAVARRARGKTAEALVEALKRFTLPVTGTLGFDYAQVTKGGIPLSETDERLQSRFAEGLYFAGEILDVDGECGGYNLQWAYSSARTVADALGEAEKRRKNRE